MIHFTHESHILDLTTHSSFSFFDPHPHHPHHCPQDLLVVSSYSVSSAFAFILPTVKLFPLGGLYLFDHLSNRHQTRHHNDRGFRFGFAAGLEYRVANTRNNKSQIPYFSASLGAGSQITSQKTQPQSQQPRHHQSQKRTNSGRLKSTSSSSREIHTTTNMTTETTPVVTSTSTPSSLMYPSSISDPQPWSEYMASRAFKEVYEHIASDHLGPQVDLVIHRIRHRRSGMDVVVIHEEKRQRPLCTLEVVVPTFPESNAGLPHCLEHLIFMGSESFPSRGFLDFLANRSLSTGTNAYTAEDHTAYTLTTAGYEAMIGVDPQDQNQSQLQDYDHDSVNEILEVFLEHIFAPTLRDDAFKTEIYSMDQNQKQIGVVFCEMQGRENTEFDLFENAWRKVLYPDTYLSYDSGGKTPDIAKLQNENVKDFHARYYKMNQSTVLFHGSFPIPTLLGSLNRSLNNVYKVVNASAQSMNSQALKQPWPKLKIPDSVTLPHHEKEDRNASTDGNNPIITHFPSEDEAVGSVNIVYKGPPMDDFKSLIALEVFMQFMVEHSASPLCQEFVEIEEPMASDIHYDLRIFPQTAPMFLFSGVPNGSLQESGEGSAASSRSRSASASNTSDSDESGSDHDDHLHNRNESQDNLENNFLLNGFILKRLNEIFTDIADNGFHEYGGGFDEFYKSLRREKLMYLKDIENNSGESIADVIKPDLVYASRESGLGSRVRMLEIFSQLELLDERYWMDLIRRWFLQEKAYQFIMVPDSKQENLSGEGGGKGEKNTSKEGKVPCIQTPDEMIAENRKIKQLLSSPIPSGDRVPRIAYNVETSVDILKPFKSTVVELDTSFVYFAVKIPTAHISCDLRQVIPLFAELVMQCDIELSDRTISYTEAVRKLSDMSIHHCVSVGIDGYAFSSGADKNNLVFEFSCESESLQDLVALFWKFFQNGKFTMDRLTPIVSNLYTSGLEASRDGATICDAVGIFLNEKNLYPDAPESNDVIMTVLRQGPFYESMVKKNKRNAAIKADALKKVDLLRKELLLKRDEFHIQIGSNDPRKSCQDFMESTLKETSGRELNLGMREEQETKRRTAKKAKRKLPRSVITAVKGVESSFMDVWVPCDVEPTHSDYVPIKILCEIFSATEGPLYNNIRGRGYAYGASLMFRRWKKSLLFSLSESIACSGGWSEFVSLLEDLNSGDSKNTLSKWNIECAISILLYRRCAARNSPGGVCKEIMYREAGNLPLDAEADLDFEKEIHKITRDRLLQVFRKYFLAFLNDELRVSVICCGPQSEHQIVKDFSKLESYRKLDLVKMDVKAVMAS